MADTFFEFDSSLPAGLDDNLADDAVGHSLDGEEEEYDALNDLTFGEEVLNDDWEQAHEKLAEYTEQSRPHRDDFDSLIENGDGLELEKSLSRLVLEENEDPQPKVPRPSFPTHSRLGDFTSTSPGHSVWGVNKNDIVVPASSTPILSRTPLPIKNVCTVEELERNLLTFRSPSVGRGIMNLNHSNNIIPPMPPASNSPYRQLIDQHSNRRDAPAGLPLPLDHETHLMNVHNQRTVGPPLMVHKMRGFGPLMNRPDSNMMHPPHLHGGFPLRGFPRKPHHGNRPMPASLKTVTLRTLDIITIVAPPALPAALTAGSVFADARLKKQGIYSVSSTSINVCGKIKVACFDKTGTMTEEGLHFWAVLPVDASGFTAAPVWRPAADLPAKSPILVAMASCHTLTRIHEDLCGDPMDLCMFITTGWELEEPGADDTTRYDMLTPTVVRPPRSTQQSKEAEELLGADIWSAEMSEFEIPYEVGIVRTFPFSSRAQCMSVITRTLGAPRMVLYTKGAPEKIIKMCAKESVTEGFIDVVNYYASAGYRVIALAHRQLEAKFSWTKAQRVTREEVEVNLRLLGLVIMQNSLKPETTPVISQLHAARTRTVMITGDNLMTAVSVARDCGMVAPDKSVVLVTASVAEGNQPGSVTLLPLYGPPPCKEMVSWLRGPSLPFHLALDGDTWSAIYSHFPEVLPSIITCGTVFARMAPEQKTQVVEELMAMDYVVAMVGDGANDCGALKVAHIGVSLSGAEASVAAPFTSSRPDITCILNLMQEGRCALTTSYCTFKYMSVYSIIQLITVLTLFTQGAMLSNMEFLYVDLFITTTLAVVMGRTGPMTNLDVTRPVGSLMSYVIVVPILLQLTLCFVVQQFSLFILQLQPWYKPLNPADAEDDEGVVVCWETTVVYGVSCFQFIVIAMVYSKKSPFRKPGYTNVWLVIVIVALLMSSTVILAYPPDFLVEALELLPRATGHTYFDNLQNWFRIGILALPLMHFFGALLIEECIADTRWLKRFLHWLFRKKEYKNKYKKVDHNLCLSSRWASD